MQAECGSIQTCVFKEDPDCQMLKELSSESQLMLLLKQGPFIDMLHLRIRPWPLLEGAFVKAWGKQD